jgi:excisionase family DNA binding protein
VEDGPHLLTLQEAADRLGVHYMTAYRYVRTGRLPATRDGVQWLVDPGAVEELQRPPRRRRRGMGRTGAVTDLANRMVAGDEPGAWKVVEAVLAGGAAPADVLLDVIAPAMRRIGDDWAAGALSVADEHRASTVASRLVGRLGPLFARRGRKRGTIVIGAVEGDDHGLPSAILTDVLRGKGYEVLDTGANTPAVSFVDNTRAANRLRAVVIGATTAGRDAAIRRTVKLLRTSDITAPILVGGAAVVDDDHARRLGSDGWTGHDGHHALRVIEALAD